MDNETEQTLRAKLHDLFKNEFGDNIEITSYTDTNGNTPNLGFTYKLHKDCFCSNNSFFCDKPCCKNIIRFVTKITKAVKEVLREYPMEKRNLKELGITHDNSDNFTFDTCEIEKQDESNRRKFSNLIVFPFTSLFGIPASQLFSRTKGHSYPVVIPPTPMNNSHPVPQPVEEEKTFRHKLDDTDHKIELNGGRARSRRKRSTRKNSRKSHRRRHCRSSHNKKRHTKRYRKRK